jgi:AraC-like DNA-binding protein
VIAEEVGFYDCAHVTRAFSEVFGTNASELMDDRRCRLVRCIP